MNKTGFSLVEVLIAAAIVGIIATAYLGATTYGLQTTVLSGNRQRATLLAEEGIEAIRNIRDEDYSSLTDGIHGISVQNNQWQLTTSNDQTDIYTREITISSVDTNTKQITSKVTWQQNPQRTGSVEIVEYLTNWRITIVPTETPTPVPSATATPTTTPQPTETPTPTPTDVLSNSCTLVCSLRGFSGGVCRKNLNQCRKNGEEYSPAGSIFCNLGKNSDTCCCQP